MISSRKKSLRKIWSGIIISIFLLLVGSFILTKVIYDASFSRYDNIPSIPSELKNVADSRVLNNFKSGENTLCGYLYNNDSDSLIVIAPGFNSSADDYIQQISGFLERGWAVFIFDPTGSCKSEGDSAVGFSQAAFDLEAALDHIEANERFGYEDIYLFGHSRGGYAVCSVLDKGYDISAAVTVSGVNTCMDAIMQPVADKIGFLAYSNYPFLWLYQSMLFGAEAVNTDASEEILESDIPVLIVQGSEDEKFTEEKYSVYSQSIDDGAENAQFLLCETDGQNGHTSLLFDRDGTANDELLSEIDSFFRQNN